MCGLGGALSSDLVVGDVVIQGEFGTIAKLPHRVLPGRIATNNEIIPTPAEKSRIFRETGAFCVDMETEYARNIALSHGFPFLAVRAISDTAAETLDPTFLNLVDPQGRPRISRALAHIVSHPTKLPSLLRLRRSTNLALANLAATLVAIITSGWPDQSPSPPHR